MAISHFFNKSIVVRRLSAVSGYKKSFVATGTVDVHIQKIVQEDLIGLERPVLPVFRRCHRPDFCLLSVVDEMRNPAWL